MITTTAEKAAPRTSRIGKRPLELPKGVSANIDNTTVTVKGPKGSLTRTFPDGVTIRQDGDVVHVSSSLSGRDGPRVQGLTRALLGSMVAGVATGYERRLELHGTGYRAEVKGKILHCTLGFSHPVDYPIPDGVTATVPPESKGALLILQGIDKELVGQVAATLRAYRPAEPYGGKGVRYAGERIRVKAGKTGK